MAEPPVAPVIPAAVAGMAASGVSSPLRGMFAMRVDHLRALIAQSPASLTGNAVGFGVMLLVFWGLADPRWLGVWGAAAVLLWVARLGHWWRYRQRERAGTLDVPTLMSWHMSWLVLVLAQGALWGVAVWLFWGLGTPYHRLSLILVVYAYTLGAVQLLVRQGAVFNAFLSLVLVPTIVRVASDSGQAFHWQLALVLVVVFVATLVIGRSHRSALAQAIGLKERTEQLAAQLRSEKAAADEARHEAEVANRAKTQFFAAASHDLRQPLHAMGLFAEALRQRSARPRGRAAGQQHQRSGRRARGPVRRAARHHPHRHRRRRGRPDSFAHRARCSRKLRLHFEPAAFEKGLALRFRGERHVAPRRPAAGRAHPAQPGLQRDPLHRATAACW